MTLDAEPFIVREDVTDEELLTAIQKVREFMRTSKDLSNCSSFFPAEDNKQNRDILHVTSSVLDKRKTDLTSSRGGNKAVVEVAEEKVEDEVEVESRWNALWSSEMKSKFSSCGESQVLRDFYKQLLPSSEARKCFVPLCGVSKDVVKLARAGHEVVGVDISSVAIQQLFRESSLDFFKSSSKHGPFETFRVNSEAEMPGEVSVLQGDIFNYLSEHIHAKAAQFAAVLDIRSLPAIPVNRRREYVRLMENVVEEGGRILLEVVEHELDLTKPPFSVSHGTVLALYANSFDVELLRTRQRGDMTERVYLLVRKAIGIPQTVLPPNITPSVQLVFRRLQAVARRHLAYLGTQLGMNTLGLTPVGDLDVLRFLNYKGDGGVLSKHVDPGLLTVHIALEEDVCVHADELARSQAESKSEAMYLTVFSSDQMGVVSRGKVKPSAHHANAERARFAITFNCYVDSTVLVAPMDNLCTPSNSVKTESGLDYVERIFGKVQVANPEGTPSEGPVLDLNLTIQDVRAHWTLLTTLYASNDVLSDPDPLKLLYETFLANIRAEAVTKGRLAAPPTPPACIRICWVAHMLQPSTYRSDCLALFGEILPHHNGDRSQVDASPEFKEWWCRYTFEEYPKTVISQCPRLKMNWEHLPSAKELHDRLVSIGTSFSRDTGKALHLLNDYKRYILAAEKNVGTSLAPGPLIDIVWHSHQTNPVAYNLDMSSRVVYLDHLPSSDGEDVKPWLMNTIKAWKDMYPGSTPPISASIQAGCGCCHFDAEAQAAMEREQEEARKRLKEARRLKKGQELRMYNLNESFHTVVKSSKAFAWSHAKVMQVSTGACSFDIMESDRSGSTTAKELIFREPVNVSYAFSDSSTWHGLDTREAVLRHIGYRVLDSNANSKKGVTIEDAKELRYACPHCSHVNFIEAAMFADNCQSCSSRIETYQHLNPVFSEEAPKAQTNVLSYSAWDLCALSSGLGTAADVFLTREGLTLVVFNLDKVMKASQERRRSRRDINNQMELSELYKVRAWLKTIHFSEPQAHVGLVGIYSGKLAAGEVEAATKAIEEILKEFDTLNLMSSPTHGRSFFVLRASARHSVDRWSLNPDVATELMQYIHKTVSQLQVFTRPLPLRWVWCLMLILQSDGEENVLKKEGEMRMEEIREVAKDAGISSVDEIENMLQCFHLLGFVFHFKSTDPIVYTKPQLLVQDIGKVLIKQQPVDREKLSQCGLIEDFKEFKSNAVISRDLLEYFWGKKRYAFLVDFMQSHYLLAGYGQVETEYYVPSLLMSPSSRLVTSGLSFHILNVPQSVYYRLVCLCISHSPPGGTAPILTRHTSQHWFGYECTLKFDDELEQLEVQVDAMHASRCLALLVTMLNKLDLQNVVLVLPEHGKIEYAQAKKQKIRPWFRLKRSGSILAEDSLLS